MRCHSEASPALRCAHSRRSCLAVVGIMNMTDSRCRDSRGDFAGGSRRSHGSQSKHNELYLTSVPRLVSLTENLICPRKLQTFESGVNGQNEGFRILGIYPGDSTCCIIFEALSHTLSHTTEAPPACFHNIFDIIETHHHSPNTGRFVHHLNPSLHPKRRLCAAFVTLHSRNEIFSR